MFAIGMPGTTELIVIGVVFALLFGAKKLPELGHGMGNGLREFKRGILGHDDQRRDDAGTIGERTEGD